MSSGRDEKTPKFPVKSVFSQTVFKRLYWGKLFEFELVILFVAPRSSLESLLASPSPALSQSATSLPIFSIGGSKLADRARHHLSHKPNSRILV